MSLSFAACATAPSHEAAVALSRGGIGLHTGLVYRDGAQARVLHLAWHHRLTDEAPTPESPWFAVRPALDELELIRVASFAKNIAAVRPEVPYALRSRGATFDEQGRYVPGGDAGLTCASFVVTVFESARVPLLDRASWEQRSPERQQEDTAAQQRLVAYLRASAAAEHVAAVEREVGCARLRSEEVAAASGLSPHPVAFAQAAPAGEALRGEVEAALTAPVEPAALPAGPVPVASPAAAEPAPAVVRARRAPRRPG